MHILNTHAQTAEELGTVRSKCIPKNGVKIVFLNLKKDKVGNYIFELNNTT